VDVINSGFTYFGDEVVPFCWAVIILGMAYYAYMVLKLRPKSESERYTITANIGAKIGEGAIFVLLALLLASFIRAI
jgi:hypothetical protein